MKIQATKHTKFVNLATENLKKKYVAGRKCRESCQNFFVIFKNIFFKKVKNNEN